LELAVCLLAYEADQGAFHIIDSTNREWVLFYAYSAYAETLMTLATSSNQPDYKSSPAIDQVGTGSLCPAFSSVSYAKAAYPYLSWISK
jgi:hypothetical protein